MTLYRGLGRCPQAGLPHAQAYFMLDEMLIGGELQEPSKKARARGALRSCSAAVPRCAVAFDLRPGGWLG